MNLHSFLVRTVIVDDDAFSRAQVHKQLERYRDAVEVSAECASGPEGIEAITAHRPDLVFLDIQMKGMDGFAMLDALPRRGFGVIFVTSHDEYAIRAIRYSALDYLLKPIFLGFPSSRKAPWKAPFAHLSRLRNAAEFSGRDS